jgi:hypothetical protein
LRATTDPTFVESRRLMWQRCKKFSHAFVDSHDDAWLDAHV